MGLGLRRVGWWLIGLACVLSCSRLARGDLMGDADALRAAWQRHRLVSHHLGSWFLVNGQTRTVAVPATLLPAAPCITILALAERRVRLLLSPSMFLPGGHWRGGGGPRSATAGIVQVTWCGATRPGPVRVGLTMSSPRGAVEVLAVGHRRPLADATVVLAARAPELLPTAAGAPTPLRLGPLAPRVARVAAAIRADGAASVVRVAARSGPAGRGAIRVVLGAGCHRLELLSAPGAAATAVDVDAEIALPTGGTTLRRDRSHAPDARLDFCLAARRALDLRYGGAAHGAPMQMVDGRWPLPAGLNPGWGDAARAGLAWALFRRRAPLVDHPPLLVLRGLPGVSSAPVDVEPGACYLAAMAVARGTAMAGRLAVRVQSKLLHDDAADEPRSAAVSFCVPSNVSVVELSVELRSAGAEWLGAVWRLSGAAT